MKDAHEFVERATRLAAHAREELNAIRAGAVASENAYGSPSAIAALRDASFVISCAVHELERIAGYMEGFAKARAVKAARRRAKR